MAISQARPQQATGVGDTVGEVEEILVLRDDDASLGDGAFPDFWIGRGIKAEIEDVDGVRTLRGEPSRYRRVAVGCPR